MCADQSGCGSKGMSIMPTKVSLRSKIVPSMLQWHSDRETLVVDTKGKVVEIQMKEGWISTRCNICWKLIASDFFPTLDHSVLQLEDKCKGCVLREAKEGKYMATNKNNKNEMKANSKKVVKKKPAAKASDWILKRL